MKFFAIAVLAFAAVSRAQVAVSVPMATPTTQGVVKPDNATITVSNGVISAAYPQNPTFTNVTINGQLFMPNGTSIPAGVIWGYETPVGGTVAVPTAIPTGGNGSVGPAGTISIGTVTTGAAGSAASVTNSGTPSAAILNFSIPQGQPGTSGGAPSTPVLYTVTVPAASLASGSSVTSPAVTISGLSTASGSIPITFPQTDPGASFWAKVDTVGTSVTVTVINLSLATQAFPKTIYNVKVY